MHKSLAFLLVISKQGSYSKTIQSQTITKWRSLQGKEPSCLSISLFPRRSSLLMVQELISSKAGTEDIALSLISRTDSFLSLNSERGKEAIRLDSKWRTFSSMRLANAASGRETSRFLANDNQTRDKRRPIWGGSSVKLLSASESFLNPFRLHTSIGKSVRPASFSHSSCRHCKWTKDSGRETKWLLLKLRKVRLLRSPKLAGRRVRELCSKERCLSSVKQVSSTGGKIILLSLSRRTFRSFCKEIFCGTSLRSWWLTFKISM